MTSAHRATPPLGAPQVCAIRHVLAPRTAQETYGKLPNSPPKSARKWAATERRCGTPGSQLARVTLPRHAAAMAAVTISNSAATAISCHIAAPSPPRSSGLRPSKLASNSRNCLSTLRKPLQMLAVCLGISHRRRGRRRCSPISDRRWLHAQLNPAAQMCIRDLALGPSNAPPSPRDADARLRMPHELGRQAVVDQLSYSFGSDMALVLVLYNRLPHHNGGSIVCLNRTQFCVRYSARRRLAPPDRPHAPLDTPRPTTRAQAAGLALPALPALAAWRRAGAIRGWLGHRRRAAMVAGWHGCPSGSLACPRHTPHPLSSGMAQPRSLSNGAKTAPAAAPRPRCAAARPAWHAPPASHPPGRIAASLCN